jgi:hypothetical protein
MSGGPAQHMAISSDPPEDNKESLHLLSLVMDKNGLEDKATVDPRKYKTRLCRNWEMRGECPYLETCCFAHGQEELRCLSDNHKLLASIGYFSNVVLLAMTNGKKPALPPHCLYQQPQQFATPQTAEELQHCAAMVPPGVKFPYQRPLLSALRELKHAERVGDPDMYRVATPPSSESSVGSLASSLNLPNCSFTPTDASFSSATVRPSEAFTPAIPKASPMGSAILIGDTAPCPTAAGDRRPRRRHPRHHKGHYKSIALAGHAPSQ